MRALVVDDSRAMRMILARALQKVGFEVSFAEHGQNALEVLSKEAAFDLALFDWNMPVMTGFELLQAVRADRKYDGIRIMMVTTETEQENVMRALAAGANEYLMKPFTPEALVEKLVMLGMPVAA
ncbi:MAG: response regulator [Deltaproteobacteria bacterium]|nr:response regulator [Deltaproteobacteria bacterium]